MARRGNGEGTIYYSEKLNKWVGQFTAGRKADGKINRKSVYGNTRKEVKEKMVRKLAEVQNRTYINKSEATIINLGNQIIENKLNANIISENTYNRLLSTLKHIENSNIGTIPIQKISSAEIQTFINSKTEYSNSTINKIHEMLGAIFKEAIKTEIIFKNPMNSILKPKSTKPTKEVEALTIEEQKAFTKCLTNEKYKNVFLIALHSGMRVGEILALTTNDIDYKNNVINVKNSLTQNKESKVIIGNKTKTYSGIRQIPITTILRPILDNTLKNYKPNRNNLLFCHLNGNLIYPSTINTQFKRICKNAGIKTTNTKKKKGIDENGNAKYVNLKTSTANVHMLRHTYATRCIEAGVPAPVLQKLLGHKDISITLNTYTTIFNRFKEEALNNYVNYIKEI